VHFGEPLLTLSVAAFNSLRTSIRHDTGRVTPQALRLMEEFVVGQKWIMVDAIFGSFMGEVIEVSEDGASGSVIIRDEEGNEVDTFTGTVTEFQASGEWRLLEA
jgi:hypothetical protein